MLMLRPLAITRQSDPGEEAAELRRKGWQHRGQQAQLWGARGLDSREKSFIFKEFRPKAKKKFSACLQTTDVNVGPRGEVVDGRPTSNTLHMKAVCKSFGAFEELYGPPTNLV